MGNQTNIGDVLSGNAPLKFEVSVDYTSAIILGITLFVAVLAACLIVKKL